MNFVTKNEKSSEQKSVFTTHESCLKQRVC